MAPCGSKPPRYWLRIFACMWSICPATDTAPISMRILSKPLRKRLTERAPKQAIWVGWSLGGLVATHMALHHSEYVAKLVTVASSPKFAAERPWRGIQPQVLSAFTDQLVDDFQTTIERFMALQAMGSPSARQDVKTLKQAVLSRPSPNPHSFAGGLANVG